MKITQALIDQAAMIANAKVGDELEQATLHGGWLWKTQPDDEAILIGSPRFNYRIKPQPRVVYVNTHKETGKKFVHDNPESAIVAAQGFHILYESIAVPFQQIGEGEQPA